MASQPAERRVRFLQFLYLPDVVDFCWLPDGMISPGLFAADEGHQTGESLIGPGDTFNASLYEDTDEGLVAIGLEGVVQVFDAADALLQQIREYDPVTDSTEPIRPFHVTSPHTFPHGDVFLS